jgi:ABC-type amino acid transport substrate-binding protein
VITAWLLPLEVDAASLAEVKERGWLRVCAHPAALPFSSQDRAQPGFQLEIAEAIAKVLGVKVIPDWIVFTRHARRASCDAIIGAVVPLIEDKAPPARGALLTKAYAGSGYVLLVPRADTAVHRPEDVKSGTIGVEYTSWPHYLLQTHGIGITAYRDQTEIIEAVAKGEVAAGMVTDPYLGWFLKEHPDAGGEGRRRLCARPRASVERRRASGQCRPASARCRQSGPRSAARRPDHPGHPRQVRPDLPGPVHALTRTPPAALSAGRV